MANRLSISFSVILTLVLIAPAFSFDQTEDAPLHLNLPNSDMPHLLTIDSALLKKYVAATFKLSNGTIVPKATNQFATEAGTYRVICKVVTNFVQLDDVHWQAKYADAANLLLYKLGSTPMGDQLTHLCYIVDAVNQKEAECLLQQDRTGNNFPRVKKSNHPLILLAKWNLAGSGLTELYCPVDAFIPIALSLTAVGIQMAILHYFFNRNRVVLLQTEADDSQPSEVDEEDSNTEDE